MVRRVQKNILYILGLTMSLSSTNFSLTSPAFNHRGAIPSTYTCEGKNISPELVWHNAPAGTSSFALIVDDPDAPGTIFVHWIIYNIPASSNGLAKNIQSGEFKQGTNSFNTETWSGPCPPSGTHRYFFTLYALDTQLTFPGNVTKEELLKAMQGHILAQTQLIGLYAK